VPGFPLMSRRTFSGQPSRMFMLLQMDLVFSLRFSPFRVLVEAVRIFLC